MLSHLNFIQSFRYSADLIHLYTFILLIQKIQSTRSCSGLSLKTQLLFLSVFITRYFDIFNFVVKTKPNIFNFFMKMFFISSQTFIIYLIKKHYITYDKRSDSLSVTRIMLAGCVLAFILKERTNGAWKYFTEYCWTYSVLIESVAILPQLILLQETGDAEALTSKYVFLLGVYRLLYVIFWGLKLIFRMPFDGLVLPCGIIQTLMFADFFVVYYRYVFKKQNSKIPN